MTWQTWIVIGGMIVLVTGIFVLGEIHARRQARERKYSSK
jgi:hypothetical protein